MCKIQHIFQFKSKGDIDTSLGEYELKGWVQGKCRRVTIQSTITLSSKTGIVYKYQLVNSFIFSFIHPTWLGNLPFKLRFLTI